MGRLEDKVAIVTGGTSGIGDRHWSVAQEGYKQMRAAFGVAAEG